MRWLHFKVREEAGVDLFSELLPNGVSTGSAMSAPMKEYVAVRS